MKLISWLFEGGRQRAFRIALASGFVLGGEVSDAEVLGAIRSVPCHYSGIAFDNAGNSGQQVGQSTYNFSYTINSGVNGFLTVDIDMLTAGQTVSGITCGATNLVSLGAISTASKRIECWGATGIAAGTYTITVTLSGSLTSTALVVSYTGVNQTTPTEAFNSNSGSLTTNPSVVITTVTDQDWVHATLSSSNVSAPTANQTARNGVTSGGTAANEDTNGVVTPAGMQTMSYTAASSTWLIAGYGIIAAIPPAVPVLSDLAQSPAYRTVMAM